MLRRFNSVPHNQCKQRSFDRVALLLLEKPSAGKRRLLQALGGI